MNHATRIALALLLLLSAAACGDDNSGAASDAASNTTATSGDTSGTGGEITPTPSDPSGAGYFEEGGFVLEDSHVNVMRTVAVVGETEPGVAPGFDLDGRVSEGGEEETCGHPDLMSPEGSPGIDNQLAVMWPALEPLVGEAATALLQGSINEGRILIMMEMVGLDDLVNDDDVTFNLYQGLGEPDIGTRGLLAPSQTYRFDAEFPHTTLEGVQVVDGEAIVGPIEMSVPIDILNVYYVLHISHVWFRIQLHEDGTFSGFFTGAFNVFDLLEELYTSNAAPEAMLVAPVLTTNTDMGNVNGECTLLSVAFTFEGTTAWVVRPESMR